jgi:hypothetical protein
MKRGLQFIWVAMLAVVAACSVAICRRFFCGARYGKRRFRQRRCYRTTLTDQEVGGAAGIKIHGPRGRSKRRCKLQE